MPSDTVKDELNPSASSSPSGSESLEPTTIVNIKPKARNRRHKPGSEVANDSKRRCVSTACIACRRRKSKCDGNTPACAACSSVYGTECVYDPNSDHRRKGVYKKDLDNLKTRNSTLQVLVQAILNSSESDVPALVRQIRSCESLDKVAQSILARENGLSDPEDEDGEEQLAHSLVNPDGPAFESRLASQMGELRLSDGSTRYIGGTSNLLYLGPDCDEACDMPDQVDQYRQHDNPITSWTTVTSDPDLIMHLLNMYFTWHYTFFTTLSKTLFWRDFSLGKAPAGTRRKTEYCTPLLVNSMLALGCHFTAHPGARADPEDSVTAGDHFFREAKRLMAEEGEFENPKLATVQALGLMSVREAGCARENIGWAYSGMSFRMACDIGLNWHTNTYSKNKKSVKDDEDDDARRITFWGGCFLFDKIWSNYLGRMPLFENAANITTPKFDVFPNEDADAWQPYTDSGFTQAHAQPSRVRNVAFQLVGLSEISGDIMKAFYQPSSLNQSPSKQAELKRLSELHTRLESWRRELPKELEPKEGGLSSVLLMHMFFQLLYIHLFRPFLKYNPDTSPLPANVSPRKLCTQAASTISKLLRLYKRSHGLRQICNIVVYIAHSACTVHLLNLPDKNAKRDITHGFKHLEEISEGWLCARRTLCVLDSQVENWKIELPDEAAAVLARTDAKFGFHPSPRRSPDASSQHASPAPMVALQPQQSSWQQQQQQQQSRSNPSTTNGSSAYSIPTSNQNPGQTPNQSQNSHLAADVTSNFNVQFPPNEHMTYSAPTSQPANTSISRPAAATTAASATSAPMPHTTSDMFGGVHALLQGQDWWVKDQGQVASGFGNWNLASDADTSNATVTSNPNSNTNTTHWSNLSDHQHAHNPSMLSKTGTVGNGNGHGNININGHANGNGTAPHAATSRGSVSSVSTNGLSTFNALNAFGFAANNYNENDWYQ